jgi:class 3 adenylate cyclase/isopentenyldiphosphate isomerase
MTTTHVITVFLDIRGFTQWSENTKANLYMKDFIGKFYQFIGEEFSGFYQKKLGDGMMLVKEMSSPPNLGMAQQEILDILNKIDSSDKWFSQVCIDFGKDYAFKIDLSLGWGIVRGDVNRVEDEGKLADYLGADINRAARLCGIARPYGIVIDKNSFYDLPQEISKRFYEEAYRLKGIAEPVEVYVTSSIRESLFPREEKKETPEIHVAGSCFKLENDQIKVLLAKRNPDRKLYPGCYEGCGGQLARNETFIEGVKRHYLKEMGIEIEVKQDCHVFHEIHSPEEPLIPGIRFLCEYKSGNPKSQRHTEIKWCSISELEAMEDSLFPPGFRKQTCDLVNQYRKHSS